MLATVDPIRFRRLGISGRLHLRAVRRRQVRLAELAHRDRYPDQDHLGAYNLQPRGRQGEWEL